MERMEKQLTVVDSLIKSILSFIDRSKVSDMMLQDIVSDHLAMEKEQIIKAFKTGNHTEMRGGKFIDDISEQYYNETFKSKICCPNCYESENIHFNIDYSKYGLLDTNEFLCNECGTYFKLKSE